MRESIKQFVKLCSETFALLEPIYEFGAFQVPEQVGWADIRPFFPGKKFIGADMREGPGVDLILDLHEIKLPDNSAGTVLCLDTFEHVEYPRKAAAEVHRILEPGGIFIFSSVMDCPIHDHPHDYWRFTPEAFRSLLTPFENSFVDHCGRNSFPHTIVGIGFKGAEPGEAMERFKQELDRWKDTFKYAEGRKKKKGIRKLLSRLGLS